MSGHYDEEQLYDYLDHPESYGDRRQLEAHLGSCASCRTTLEQLREFEAALSTTALWDFAEAVRRTRDTPNALRSLADNLAAEDEAAETFLRPLLASPAGFRRANIAASRELHNAGIVRKLCAVSRELRERQPMHALSLADAAVTVAEQLSPGRYPAAVVDDLRGNAWLERANVLRYLGRFNEALDALDLAEQAFAQTPVAIYSTALVQYLRSVIFFKSDRLDEATRLARLAARVFQQFGEEERYVHAKIVQAGVMFVRNDFSQALDQFLALVPIAKRLGDAVTLARLYGNVANCLLGLEDLETAARYFQQALSLYEAQGLATEKIRTRWSLARLQLRAGEWDNGIAMLRETKREFETLGVTSDSALVTLDLVEALLARGSSQEVAQLCSGLVESFVRVGMTGNALTALAFLREAGTVGSITPILIRHVRNYLEKLPGAAERPFEPPQS